MTDNMQTSSVNDKGTIDPPQHVAIIMDGNGRWAAARGLARRVGHQKGVEAVRRAVRAAGELNISYLTLFSFSSENWSRPVDEVQFLMGLMKRFIRQDLAELHKANVRIRVIGERYGVDPDLLTLIDEACELTKPNSGLNLVVAFNYGARAEMVAAARRIADDVARGRLRADEITEQHFSAALDTCDIPDPDLLIRTSGELRLSNFLLWQLAYAEFVFQDIFWPDFERVHLEEAIDTYRSRERRYGGTPRQSAG